MTRHSFAPLTAILLFGAAACALPIACGGGENPDPGYRPVTSGAGGSGGEGGASSSKAASSSGGDGGTMAGSGGMGGAGGSGGGGGEDCVDTGISEPNEAEASATKLGDLVDCDADSSGMVAGVLVDGSDVDWYSFNGTDGVGCTVDPTRSLAASDPIELCKYVQCVNGTATFSCPAGTTDDASPAGHPGCCGSQGFSLDPDCEGIDEDTTVYIRLKNPGGFACVQYTMQYHY
jgi:hypothetical protein